MEKGFGGIESESYLKKENADVVLAQVGDVGWDGREGKNRHQQERWSQMISSTMSPSCSTWP